MNKTESPIKEISIKEKVKMARKEHGDEVAKKVADDELNKEFNNQPEKRNDIVYPEDIINKTDHLPNYQLLKNVVALQGSEYTMMIKEIYKSLVAMSAPQNLRIIKVGKIKTDLRVSINNILSSGKGKKNISVAMKKILLRFNPEANIKEPRTIHYQHLIGKMLLRKEEEICGEKKDGTPKYKKIERYIPKYGFLNADLLILEEAYELFNSKEKNDVDCRDAIIVALDCFGDNYIQKQNMDNLDTKEETLGYYPYVTIISFLQPLMVQETFVTKGLSRRLHTNYKEFPEKTNLDKYVSRLRSDDDDEKSCTEFSKFMKKINNVSGQWKLSDDAYDSYILCHSALLEQGFRLGGKIAHYTRILEYPMQNILLKMSALNALCNLRTTITKQDVELAFLDIIERITHEFIYISKKVKGTLDYGEDWSGATGKIQQCLEKLHDIGANSRENSINIWAFQKIIEQVYDISNRRSKDKYKSMKEEGFICDYLGQGKDNGVWLNFEPKIRSEEEIKNDDLLNPKKLYLEISGRTAMSGMTPKTPKTRINKSNISSYIDITKGIDTFNDTSNNLINTTKLQKVKNTPLGVIPDIPDIPDTPEVSDRDTQYYEDPVCVDIKPCDKDSVLEYTKQNKKVSTQELIEKFGVGVMKLKKEGLI